MPQQVYWYPQGLKTVMNKEWDANSDTLKVALLTSAYTFSYLHDYWNDVSASETSGTGYTAGGVTMTSVAVTITTANSWTAWTTNTAYGLGAVRRPSAGNGFVYRAIVAGTSHGATEPTWPTSYYGQTVVDNTVTWMLCGKSALKLAADNAQWTGATLIAAYAVIYDTTPGTAATDPLIALADLGGSQSVVASTFAVNWAGTDGISAVGLWHP